MVKATKAGENDLFSQCMLHGNFPKTGPGSSKVLRGDWNAGLMDILTPAQMFTIAGLKTAIGQATSWGGTVAESGLTAWYKFVYKGKILFIPNTVFSAASVLRWADIYNAGLIYGVDGPGTPPFDLVTGGLQPAVTATVNQKKVVTVGSDSFLVRAPSTSLLPTNQELPALSDNTPFIGSEWWETMCKLTTVIGANDIPYIGTLKWFDHKSGIPHNLGATQHFLANKIAVVLGNSNWSTPTSRATNSTVAGGWLHWVPVLELIP
jgi:hypothetical protein